MSISALGSSRLLMTLSGQSSRLIGEDSMADKMARYELKLLKLSRRACDEDEDINTV